MVRLVQAYDALIAALAWLAGAAVVLMFVLILSDVALRTAGVVLPAFAVTIVEYALVYQTLLAAPYLLRTHGHVYIDVLISQFPPALRRRLEQGVYLVCIVACIIVASVAARLFVDALGSHRLDVRGVDVPVWVILLPLPLGFMLVATEFARFLVTGTSYYSARSEASEKL